MENDFETFDPQQSLRTIRQTIDLAKRNIGENGFYFLLWGMLVAGASLADWYIGHFVDTQNHGLPWLAMMVVGVPVSLIYGWVRSRAGKTPGNIVNHWYGMIWAGFGISLGLVLAMSGFLRVVPVPFVLVVAAFATFMSGVVLQFLPLRLGGAALWAGAVLCFWVKPADQSLVEAATIVLGYIVPGLLLNRQYRQNHAS